MPRTRPESAGNEHRRPEPAPSPEPTPLRWIPRRLLNRFDHFRWSFETAVVASAASPCGSVRGLPDPRTDAGPALVHALDRRPAGVHRPFAPHQQRHAHALWLAHEGVPLIVIQRQLGHSTLDLHLQLVRQSTSARLLAARPRAQFPAWPGIRSWEDTIELPIDALAILVLHDYADGNGWNWQNWMRESGQ